MSLSVAMRGNHACTFCFERKTNVRAYCDRVVLFGFSNILGVPAMYMASGVSFTTSPSSLLAVIFI